MTNIKLTDLQIVLLAAAAQRDDGSLLPPPDHLADQAARIRKVISPLIKRAMVTEAPTTDAAKVWREEGEDRFALIITDAGRLVIGVGEPTGAPDPAPSKPAPVLAAPASPSLSKSDQVLALLRRDEGATLEELVSATGWLPHSTRAALTGLRKKGHAIERDKREDTSCYRIKAQA